MRSKRVPASPAYPQDTTLSRRGSTVLNRRDSAVLNRRSERSRAAYSERSRTVRNTRASTALSRRRKKVQPHIDLVPLMDTIFLLLFFFLCAAIVQSSNISARLDGQGERLEKYHTVTITSQNVSGLENLDAAPVLIKTDSDVYFGRVDEVLRSLQDKGLAQVNFIL